MRLGGLVNHRLNQRSISRLLVIDGIEHRGTGIIGFLHNLWLHLVLLTFLSQTLSFFLCLTLFLFLISTESSFQYPLPFKAALLYLLQFTGIVIHFGVASVTAASTSATIGTTTSIAGTAIISVGIDVLARLCQTALQVFEFFLLTCSLGILSIDVVQFTLGVAAHRTVGFLLVITQCADGGIGTVLAEMLVHFSHLVTHLLIGGIGQRHVDVVRHHALLRVVTSLGKLRYFVGQEYDGKEDDQREDVLRLFQIKFLHLIVLSLSCLLSVPIACT